MEKIVFLDIDGVLNDNDTYIKERTPDGFCGIDDEKVLKLKEIIDRTGAKIVLMSSWKDFWKDKENPDSKYLTDKLAKFDLEIMDCTVDEWWNRGEGVLNYIEEYGIETYVLLDDEIFDDYKDTVLLDHLVHTVEEIGITDEDVEEAIKILGEIEEA